MVYSATRASDGKILYFYDIASKEEWEDMHDEELIDEQWVYKVPFGEEVYDYDEDRKTLKMMMDNTGISFSELTKAEILGVDSTDHSYEDTDKRLSEYRKMQRHVVQVPNSKNEIDTENLDAREITARKNIVFDHRMFKALIEQKNTNLDLVKKIFAEHNLDLDKLDEYFDEDLNRELPLEEQETSAAYEEYYKQYKETDAYKKHKNLADAISESYEALSQEILQSN